MNSFENVMEKGERSDVPYTHTIVDSLLETNPMQILVLEPYTKQSQFIMTQKTRVSENVVGNVENTGDQHFLLLPTMFSKATPPTQCLENIGLFSNGLMGLFFPFSIIFSPELIDLTTIYVYYYFFN